MINGKNFFDQPVKNDQTTHDKVGKFRQVKKTITQLPVYCIMFF